MSVQQAEDFREALVQRDWISGDLARILPRLLPRLGARFGVLYAQRDDGLEKLVHVGDEADGCPGHLSSDLVAPPGPCDRAWLLVHQGRTVGRLVLGGEVQFPISGAHVPLDLSRLAACVERHLIGDRRLVLEQRLSRAREVEERRVRSHAVVSHQLKTPLQLGQSLVSDALAHVPDTVRIGRRLDTLYESLKRFNRSMVALFDRHGIRLERHRRQMVPVNLLSQCEELLKELEPALRRKRLSVNLDVSPEVWGLADPLRLEIVLDNLLGNAIKAAPRDSGIAIAVRTGEGRALFRFTNPGGPIPSDRLERLFRPMSPNPEDPTSTGLGLSLSHDYLLQMNGGLELVAHEQGEVVFEGWVGLA